MAKKRWLIQLLFALGLNVYIPAFFNKTGLYQGILKSFNFPVLNCYASPSAIFSCPAGSLQYFTAVRLFPYFTLALLFLPAIIAGRFFCGWLCPFGFVQDLLNKLGRSLNLKKVALPKSFSYLKYAFLIITVLLLPIFFMEPVFCKICPLGTFQAGIPQVILSAELRQLIGPFYWFKIALLGGFLISFLFIPRFFCRAICPVGAIMALFNRVSILQMDVDYARCNRCGMCRKLCPTDINIYDNPAHQDCVRCLACSFCEAVSVKSLFKSAEKSV